MTHEEFEEFKVPLIWVLLALVVLVALFATGCDERERRAHHERHCNLMFEHGHAQPCRP
jgi:hypothetical protein